jgi:hypothetical protein
MVEENLNPIFENGAEHLAEKISDCGKVEVCYRISVLFNCPN